MGFLRAHISRHRRFYISALMGLLTWFATGGLAHAERYAVAGDTFLGVYLVLMSVLAFQTSPENLKNEAKTEDEGVALILVITIAAIAFSLTSIFTLLNQTNKPARRALRGERAARLVHAAYGRGVSLRASVLFGGPLAQT
jgi:uncharacterized membrane protein